MNHYPSMRMVKSLLIIALLYPTVMSFSRSCTLQRSSFHVPAHLTYFNGLLLATADDNGDNGDNSLIADNKIHPKAEYGVSYIGGDPCGSKYNDDPFDVQVQKPGMPDDMKARIQALVDKKVAEEKAAAENSSQ